MISFLLNYPIKEILGILAGIVSSVAYIPYVSSIFTKKTKPSRSSWWIWSFIGLLILFSYRSVGAFNTIWVPVIFFIAPLIVAVLSLRFGENTGLNSLDKICLLGAAISIIFWLLFNSAEVALYINIFIDFLGYLPTLKKTFLNPFAESRLTWILFFLGSILNVIAIDKFTLSIALYPAYMIAMDIVMLLLIFVKR